MFAYGQKKKQGLDRIQTLLCINKLKYLYGKNVVVYEAGNLGSDDGFLKGQE
ncbi:hypothetical protein [Aquiflexum gelatinilyticum]|uniref:hypothetical protein n=1 Tax=Aquiflexum gelatinilyticum TaxID=2961943 RepID=UPI002166CA88|nr:hypothetical protein [Aquiflexum gelatinilyticum]MCS4435342.1 hypothetical protein [Aquiflexum gelatinilyticum]